MQSSATIQARAFLRFVGLLLALCAFSSGASGAKTELGFKVSHAPKQPKTGDQVVITVEAPRESKLGGLVLQYQVVEPGKYVALRDPAYKESWTSIALSKPARKKDEADAESGALTAELPKGLQRNRHLIRYRVYSAETKAILAPDPEDAQPNFAYFVYDGIPEWQGAINPKGAERERKLVTVGSRAMRSVQAYHLISKQQSIENVTWLEPKHYSGPAAGDYQYTGTFVASGKVYDHVPFRARGGTWRHAMGKNMWKINFLKGHHLEARDNWDKKYEKKWDKLNLGACIQQGDYGMRGEHGMLEAISYRLFNLAGVEAPHTHWVQLRIVDSPVESPADQYRGDFWGLYLAVENVDDEFLEEHGMPDGNLYKMDVGGPEPEHTAAGAPSDGSDARQFMSALQRMPDEKWWSANVDLPRYYSYRAMLECIHHYDLDMGKNYYYFHDLKAKRWQVIPWDVDLTWGDQMFGRGMEPFYRAGVFQHASLKADYLARLAEIRDLLFNPEQVGALIDEYAAVINSSDGGGPTIVDADRMKWDYHPIMSSRYTVRGKSDPGLFYRSSRTRDFKGMTQLMKQYAQQRCQWVDQTLLTGGSFARTPTIARADSSQSSATEPKFHLSSPKSARSVKWRLADVTQTKEAGTTADKAGKYEISAVWEKEGSSAIEIPTKVLEKRHSYRIRVRIQDDEGRWSHWSEPEQFTAQ